MIAVFQRVWKTTEGEYGESSKNCGDSGHGAFRSGILQWNILTAYYTNILYYNLYYIYILLM